MFIKIRKKDLETQRISEKLKKLTCVGVFICYFVGVANLYLLKKDDKMMS